MKNPDSSRVKRDQLRKARRLAYEAATRKASKPAATREVHVTATRFGTQGMTLHCRTGLFGGQQGPRIGVSDLELAGAVDDPREFGLVAARLGLLVLATLFGTNPHAPDIMQTTIAAACKWTGLDLEALAKELDAERVAAEQEQNAAADAVMEANFTEVPDPQAQTPEEQRIPVPPDDHPVQHEHGQPVETSS